MIPRTTRAATRSLTNDEAADRGALEGELVESLSARDEVVAWGRQDLALTATEASSERLGAIGRVRATVRGSADGAAAAITGTAAVATFAVGVVAVGDGNLAAVLLAGLPLITISAFEAVQPLSAAAEDGARAAAAVRRLDEITLGERAAATDEPLAGGTVPASEHTITTPPGQDPDEPAERPAALELRDVWFSYAGPQVLAGPTVLAGLTVSIRQGSTAVIRGPSGAGKSTVVDLLCDFLGPDSGTVALMGVDISPGDDRRAISELVTVVRQHDHLFDTTVRDNLALAQPEATDDELLVALRAADADHFVSDAPGGLGHRIGPNGERLSGGERQRLMIARALLRDAPVLVLDEATTHLESRSEQAVVEGVMQWQEASTGSEETSRTVVFISHHPPVGLAPEVTFEIRDGLASATPGPLPEQPSAPR